MLNTVDQRDWVADEGDQQTDEDERIPPATNSEIDIQEFIHAHRMHSALHAWTYDNDRGVFVHWDGDDEEPPWSRESTPGIRLVDRFHTYTMKRQD
jgi:hypothetical protein